MKQSWLARNLVMNFVIIFALLLTEKFDLELIPSMIIAYYLSEVIGAFLFKIPVFHNPNYPPTIKRLSWGYAGYLILPALITGFIVSEIIRTLVQLKVHEGQAIVYVVLLTNLILATIDHTAMKTK